MTGTPGDMTETPYRARRQGLGALSDVLEGGWRRFLHAELFAPGALRA
jgi:hypothetical protein